jgi:hypothetical protein
MPAAVVGGDGLPSPPTGAEDGIALGGPQDASPENTDSMVARGRDGVELDGDGVGPGHRPADQTNWLEPVSMTDTTGLVA